MKNIKLITFRGCQSSVEFHDMLEDAIAENRSDVTLQLHIVSSLRSAQEGGLFGAPTIVVDGQEYQGARRGPAGFY